MVDKKSKSNNTKSNNTKLPLISKLIKNRIETMQEFNEKYKLDKMVNELTYRISEDNKSYEIELFYKKKHILTCVGKLIGTYNILISTWYWSYVLEYVNKDLILKKNEIEELQNKLKKEYKLSNKKEHFELDITNYLLSNPILHMPGSFEEKYPHIVQIALGILKSQGILLIPIGDRKASVSLNDKDKVKMISLFSVDKIKQIK